jgi:hypothetical protein
MRDVRAVVHLIFNEGHQGDLFVPAGQGHLDLRMARAEATFVPGERSLRPLRTLAITLIGAVLGAACTSTPSTNASGSEPVSGSPTAAVAPSASVASGDQALARYCVDVAVGLDLLGSKNRAGLEASADTIATDETSLVTAGRSAVFGGFDWIPARLRQAATGHLTEPLEIPPNIDIPIGSDLWEQARLQWTPNACWDTTLEAQALGVATAPGHRVTASMPAPATGDTLALTVLEYPFGGRCTLHYVELGGLIEAVYQDDCSDWFNGTAKGRSLLFVEVSIENVSNASVTIRLGDFKLLARSGAVHVPIGAPLYANTPKGFIPIDRQLRPGASVKGLVAFSAPQTTAVGVALESSDGQLLVELFEGAQSTVGP